ncbi:MAG: alpha/beta hydrolase [Alphaproteobacteria bacterium]|nr:alpha/beta hydrolase [Alphaproteobacteria bacterium]
MAAIDYESQYRPSTAIAGTDAILAGWSRDAAAYRQDRLAAGRAVLDIPYGDSARQLLDLLLPDSGTVESLALFIHGGWWQMGDRRDVSHFARGLVGQGFAVALASYDLCPAVSLPTIVEQLRRASLFLWRRHQRPLLVVGHSAGGHLTAAMAATDWPAFGGPQGLVRAAYPISGAFDLLPLLGTSMNRDWKLDANTANALSPIHWDRPQGVAAACAVGALESAEFRRQSREFSQAWGVPCSAVSRANHFTVLQGLTDPLSDLTEQLTQL